MAVLAVSNIVKSSLGPQGLDKMLVDDIGDVTITNDGATILKLLEVEHPAARVLVELSQIQDREVFNFCKLLRSEMELLQLSFSLLSF